MSKKIKERKIRVPKVCPAIEFELCLTASEREIVYRKVHPSLRRRKRSGLETILKHRPLAFGNMSKDLKKENAKI